ncbi:unnamed protein product [Phytophthora lilii]|uniref:Unnamed protein product n=1 Tax=Phytophthora lilii TaxID=2077276 RepID=A0A9W6YL12_9STRA|nr:unnamed protein product [Phytophthora lilii]
MDAASATTTTYVRSLRNNADSKRSLRSSEVIGGIDHESDDSTEERGKTMKKFASILGSVTHLSPEDEVEALTIKANVLLEENLELFKSIKAQGFTSADCEKYLRIPEKLEKKTPQQLKYDSDYLFFVEYKKSEEGRYVKEVGRT